MAGLDYPSIRHFAYVAAKPPARCSVTASRFGETSCNSDGASPQSSRRSAVHVLGSHERRAPCQGLHLVAANRLSTVRTGYAQAIRSACCCRGGGLCGCRTLRRGPSPRSRWSIPAARAAPARLLRKFGRSRWTSRVSPSRCDPPEDGKSLYLELDWLHVLRCLWKSFRRHVDSPR